MGSRLVVVPSVLASVIVNGQLASARPAGDRACAKAGWHDGEAASARLRSRATSPRRVARPGSSDHRDAVVGEGALGAVDAREELALLAGDGAGVELGLARDEVCGEPLHSVLWNAATWSRQRPGRTARRSVARQRLPLESTLIVQVVVPPGVVSVAWFGQAHT